MIFVSCGIISSASSSSAMVRYVLHYFRFHGRAEATRLAFKLAGVDYQEKYIEWPSAEWEECKQRYPTQQVPVLEVDGKIIGQSKAILRYVGREFGLYGKTSLDAAYIDQAIDTAEDIWAAVNDTYVGTKEQQAAKTKTFLTEVVPPVYASLDRQFAVEPAGEYIVGNSITIADLFFFTAVDFVNFVSRGANSLEKFPKLTTLKSRIASDPKIAAWLAERPPEPPYQPE
ncbi:hematopoietic prostaglandin D synthase-like [Patiria miniata]|uniref:Glutathione S-transferase n=1 Tax=Patiria miniata TaxID=46514 RepID=A0A914BGZ0_PATMI|nr:hematopoietic prostaglandin D synthase-like [Patiria miniata]